MNDDERCAVLDTDFSENIKSVIPVLVNVHERCAVTDWKQSLVYRITDYDRYYRLHRC